MTLDPVKRAAPDWDSQSPGISWTPTADASGWKARWVRVRAFISAYPASLGRNARTGGRTGYFWKFSRGKSESMVVQSQNWPSFGWYPLCKASRCDMYAPGRIDL